MMNTGQAANFIGSAIPIRPRAKGNAHVDPDMKQSASSHLYQELHPGIFRRFVGLVYLLFGTSSAIAGWHGELSLLSDYVYRGYSKSRSNPVVRGHLGYEDDAGWFTGIWLSQVSFDDRSNRDYADLEVRPYLGWALPLATDWQSELSVTGYVYDGKIFAQDANYVEFYAALHYQNWFSGAVSVAPDAYQRHATVLNYELSYRQDILDTLRFSAGLGYSQAGALLDKDFFYWNVGASWFLTSYLSLDVRYVDVHLDERHYGSLESNYFYPRVLEDKYLLSVTFGF